jgi:O-antigen/teichoic acid export membrane protein
MKREFLLNLFFLVAVNVLIKPFFIFGIDTSVQNLVGKSTYGVYYALSSFTVVFQILSDLGIQQYNTRAIAQDTGRLSAYFPQILRIKLVLAAFYLGVIFLAAWAIGYESAYYPMLFFLAINALLVSAVNYFRSNISALGYYRLQSILSVLDRFLLIVVCGIMLWVPAFRAHFSIFYFVLAQTGTLLLTALVGFYFVWREVPQLNFRINKPLTKEILKESFPYALVIFLMFIYARTDVVMLERILPKGEGDFQSGIYAAAYRLLDAANMLGFIFASLLMPMFARELKEKGETTELLRLSFQVIMVAASSLAAVVVVHRHSIMALLYNDTTPFMGDVLGVLIVSFMGVSGIYIFSTLLGAAEQSRTMNRVFVVAIVLNLAANFYLIPAYKAMGSAISTCFTQIIVMLGLMQLSLKHLCISPRALGILPVLGFVVAIFSLNYFLKYTDIFQSWLIQAGLAGFSSILLAFAFGIFEVRKIKSLLGNYLRKKK